MSALSKPPIVWVVAGSDCSGGAGLSADLRACGDFGSHACPVLTTVTAQNMRQLRAVYPLDVEQVWGQLLTLATEMPPQAIKLGTLGDAGVLGLLTDFLRDSKAFVVCDPVLETSGGGALLDHDGIEAIRKQLLRHVDLLTPNLPELKQLSRHMQIHQAQDVEEAAKALIEQGAKSVLVKGGHSLEGQENFCCDYWTDGATSYWLQGARIQTAWQRGTGCTLASAVAAAVASGHHLLDALVLARLYLNRRLNLGRGATQIGALALHDSAEHLSELPTVHPEYPNTAPPNFTSCSKRSVALCPIVDSAEWVERLLRLGVRTIQLRIKSGSRQQIVAEMGRAIALSRRYQARIIINDYWRMAIELGAWGVHLGQSDLGGADLNAIATAGLRLGISVHSWHELALAHALAPSYIAIGAIFATTSKAMPTAPQGLERLRRWCSLLKVRYPVVAIGGISTDNALDVLEAGADGIAMISAITEATDWAAATQHFLRISNGTALPDSASTGRRSKLRLVPPHN